MSAPDPLPIRPARGPLPPPSGRTTGTADDGEAPCCRRLGRCCACPWPAAHRRPLRPPAHAACGTPWPGRSVPGRPQPGMQILGADEDTRPGQRPPDRVLLDAHPDHPPASPRAVPGGGACRCRRQQSSSSGLWLRICARGDTNSS